MVERKTKAKGREEEEEEEKDPAAVALVELEGGRRAGIWRTNKRAHSIAFQGVNFFSFLFSVYYYYPPVGENKMVRAPLASDDAGYGTFNYARTSYDAVSQFSAVELQYHTANSRISPPSDQMKIKVKTKDDSIGSTMKKLLGGGTQPSQTSSSSHRRRKPRTTSPYAASSPSSSSTSCSVRRARGHAAHSRDRTDAARQRMFQHRHRLPEVVVVGGVLDDGLLGLRLVVLQPARHPLQRVLGVERR